LISFFILFLSLFFFFLYSFLSLFFSSSFFFLISSFFLDSKSNPEPTQTSSTSTSSDSSRPWEDIENVLLIQAFKLFPGGTLGRYETKFNHCSE